MSINGEFLWEVLQGAVVVKIGNEAEGWRGRGSCRSLVRAFSAVSPMKLKFYGIITEEI